MKCPSDRRDLVRDGTWWRCPQCHQGYILPNPGFQQRFCASSADIVLLVGGAGPGKTAAMILAMARWTPIGGYRAWLLREKEKDLTKTDGLVDQSRAFYEPLGATWYAAERTFRFECDKGSSSIQLGHVGRGYRQSFTGPQAAGLGIDELDQISSEAFWWFFTRLRSPVAPVRVRATMNPDMDSWVYQEIANQWVDEDGFPRAGVPMRLYLAGRQGAKFWGRTREEVAKMAGVDCSAVLSVEYMTGELRENDLLTGSGYEGRIGLASAGDSMRLGPGPVRWVRGADLGGFRKEWFEGKVVEDAPPGTRWIRIWDPAATPGHDSSYSYTAGLKMGISPEKRIYIGHLVCGRWDPGDVELRIQATAGAVEWAALGRGGAEPGCDAPEVPDGRGIEIWLLREKAGAGVSQLAHFVRLLSGWKVEGGSETGDKDVRAAPFKAQCKAGNVYLVRGTWIETFIRHLCRKGRPDDVKDCCSAGFERLTGGQYQVRAEDLAGVVEANPVLHRVDGPPGRHGAGPRGGLGGGRFRL